MTVKQGFAWKDWVDMKDRIMQIFVIIVSATAIMQLVLSHLAIRIMRLSAAEHTGISYFAFIIFGLVTVFTVTRMRDSFFGKFFAVIMNFVTALAGLWCLRLLFSDDIFFRNLYYNLNRQTQMYELLPMSGRISASVPLALIILGAALYCLCGLVILTAAFAGIRKKPN